MSHDPSNAAHNEGPQEPEQETSPKEMTQAEASSAEPEEEQLEYDSFSENIEPLSTEETNEAEVNADQQRIAELEQEVEKTRDLMMRTVAEAENGRKRALKEREDASKFAVAGFSRDILGVADNLRRALEAIPSEMLEQHPQVKNLTDGIEATERELLRAFEKNGIEKTDPLGEIFDPNFHEVMFETPMPDKTAGEVIQVIEPGYTLNGRILRPARVGVAKNDGENQGDGSTGPGQTINTEV